MRVYSGELRAGEYVYNATAGRRERVSRLMEMHANDRAERRQVGAGDIAAVVGFKNTTTGDTLCDERNPLILEKIEFAEPVVHVAIEPKTRGDQEQLYAALGKLSEEDPTFKIRVDEETGQTLMSGMGELHLEILIDRLFREFRVEANVGRPQVAYKEGLRRRVAATGRFVRQTGGRGQYGHVELELGPAEPGSGLVFESKVVGGRIPKEYINPVRDGIREAMFSGPVAGYPVEDVRVTLLDGSYHDVDSSEMAFRTCASMAMKEAGRKGAAALLEPIFSIEIVTPEEYMGAVIGDMSSRRGKIANLDERGGAKVITGEIPLAESFGYATDLRSVTQGRATYTMQFAHYAPTPRGLTDKMLKKAS